MKLKNDYNALIIVGSWNNSIFTPDWISKFLFQKENVKIEIPVNFLGPPKFSTDDVRLVLEGTKLNLIPVRADDETFSLIQEMAEKIADYLPHTPVTAFGVNFIFIDKNIGDFKELFKLEDSGQLEDYGTKLKKTKINRVLEIDKKQINFNIELTENEVQFNFNFHYNIQNLAELKEKLSDNNILSLKNVSKKLLSEVYQASTEKDTKDEGK